MQFPQASIAHTNIIIHIDTLDLKHCDFDKNVSMSPVVIRQLGASHPLRNSKERKASSSPVGLQYPWTACFQINLRWSCFHKKDGLPAAIINCFRSCAVRAQSLIKSLSQALQMPAPHKPLRCLHFLSCCEEPVLGPALVCSCWGTGDLTLCDA